MERVSTPPPVPERKPDSHKGTFGRVLLAVGSPEMPGAAVLAALGALRGGAGLVTVAAPRSVLATLGAAAPEATQLPLREPEDAGYAAKLDAALGPRLDGGADVVALGPGLGQGASAQALVAYVAAHCETPLVLDADALNIIAGRPDIAPRCPERCIWTPHPGEFQRLAGEKPRGETARVEACQRFAAARGGVVVLKGHRTVVLEAGRCYVNSSGNPGMATGGAGDVLTGVVAALAGQGLAPFDAAALGVSLHGSAGDLAAEALGEHSLIAGDLVDFLPEAFLQHSVREPPERG